MSDQISNQVMKQLSDPQTAAEFIPAFKVEHERLQNEAIQKAMAAKHEAAQQALSEEMRERLLPIPRIDSVFRANVISEYSQRGLGDMAITETLTEDELDQIRRDTITNAFQLAMYNIEKAKQDKLYAAYMEECKQYPRGHAYLPGKMIILQKYLAMGMRRPGEELPQPDLGPKLTNDQRADLVSKCKAELMAHRGQLSAQMNIKDRYVKMGLTWNDIS